MAYLEFNSVDDSFYCTSGTVEVKSFSRLDLDIQFAVELENNKALQGGYNGAMEYYSACE